MQTPLRVLAFLGRTFLSLLNSWTGTWALIYTRVGVAFEGNSSGRLSGEGISSMEKDYRGTGGKREKGHIGDKLLVYIASIM